MELFYHDVKAHMSPSAMSSWKQSRSSFIKSYFELERGPETKAMQAGTAIHRLIEGGMIPAQCVYDHHEAEIKVQVPGSAFYFMGKPDSRTNRVQEQGQTTASFVDYKSGKANDWKEKLPTDIKMKATAWLVWMATENPDKVYGHIEYIQTTWDPEAKAVVPVEGKETELISITYTAEELDEFSRVIVKTMQEVNDFYLQWKESSGEFVSQEDIDAYLALDAKIETLTMEQDEIKARIMGQMDFGGVLNHKTDLGTFYITEKDTYSYPEELPFKVEEESFTLEKADKVAAGLKAAKKNFELINEPISTSRSIGFRAPTKKK